MVWFDKPKMKKNNQIKIFRFLNHFNNRVIYTLRRWLFSNCEPPLYYKQKSPCMSHLNLRVLKIIKEDNLVVTK